VNIGRENIVKCIIASTNKQRLHFIIAYTTITCRSYRVIINYYFVQKRSRRSKKEMDVVATSVLCDRPIRPVLQIQNMIALAGF